MNQLTLQQVRTDKRACSVCRKTRNCSQSMDDADNLTRVLNNWAPYYCLKDCLNLTPTQRAAKRKEVREAKQLEGPKPRFAYPVIGGPLDGQYATTFDFYNDGIYHHLTREYFEYNSAFGSRSKIGARPSMVIIHSSVLRPLIAPRNR